MRLTPFSTVLFALLLIGCTASAVESGYRVFRGEYRVEYPDYFQDIDMMEGGRFVRFFSATQPAYMQIVTMTQPEAERERRSRLQRGWREANIDLPDDRGKALVLYTDLRRSPEEGVHDCSFSYLYLAPMGEKDVAAITYQVSDPDWRSEKDDCPVYENDVYADHINQIARIIATYQP